MAACLVDRFGRALPRSYAGLYPAPSQAVSESRPRPILRPQTFQNITAWQRWELMNYARVIMAGVPNIAAALEMKANFAFADACFVKYKTRTPWTMAAADHINQEFYPDCNVLGPEHDFWTTMTELTGSLDTDGGYGMVFDDESGKVNVIPATRIGNGWGLNDTGSKSIAPLGKGWADYGMWGLTSGGWSNYGGMTYGYMVINDPKSPFNGARIIDGMIVDRNMVRIGVRVLGFDERGNMSYADLPASQIHINFKSKWTDQIGFIPTLATAIMAIIKVEDFDYYIKQAMILSSAMAVTRKTKDGIPRGSGIQETEFDQQNHDGTTTKRLVRVEERAAGLVELSTDNNEEIGHVPFNRPSMNEEQFVQRVERGYLAKHWPYDLIYGKEMGRAFVRAVGQQVKMIVWDTQRAGLRTIRWMNNQRLAWAMRKGRLAQNNAGFAPYDYHVVRPAEFTTDEGNDRDSDRQDLKMSLTTRTHITGKNGEDAEEIDEIRKEEESRLATNAIEMEKKFPFLTASQWLERLDQRSPNPAAITAEPPGGGGEQEETEGTEPPKKP